MKTQKVRAYPETSIIALLGKRVQLKNIIGNMILNNKDAFVTVSDSFEWKAKKLFKIIKTPDFFNEGCLNPDQQIIDLMALSYPGPKLFILAVDSENTKEEKVMAQIKQLQDAFGEKITSNLAVTLPDIESFQSLNHLREKLCIMLTIANENLASKCVEWCSGRQPFLYDYKSYIEKAVNRRRATLQNRGFSGHGSPPYGQWRADISEQACGGVSEPDQHTGMLQKILYIFINV
ncbi:uncharacterized protein LOC115789777 [Archocentrus centrarchus]|uniref:uncharacterized protein LOC115789777 n=1 Tax=Archocentrus centrarchus TaxID=63155 RepID=UPI0011EA08D8|nr:uncharacterized protein LOC115789777 [Archocentrus centrarchus]